MLEGDARRLFGQLFVVSRLRGAHVGREASRYCPRCRATSAPRTSALGSLGSGCPAASVCSAGLRRRRARGRQQRDATSSVARTGSTYGVKLGRSSSGHYMTAPRSAAAADRPLAAVACHRHTPYPDNRSRFATAPACHSSSSESITAPRPSRSAKKSSLRARSCRTHCGNSTGAARRARIADRFDLQPHRALLPQPTANASTPLVALARRTGMT